MHDGSGGHSHTHMRVVARFNRTLVVNPDTAGDPRFGPAMSCAVLVLVSGDVRLIFADVRI